MGSRPGPVASLSALALVAVLATVLVGLAPPASAQDEDVVGMLLPGEKARFPIGPTEKRSIAIGGLAGGRWTVSARYLGKGKDAPTFELIDPLDAVAPVAIVTRGRKSTAAGVAFGTTGVWRALVSADELTGGTVEIAVTAKPPKAPQPNGEHGAEDGHFAFDALPGSTCDLTLRLADRSAPDLAADVVGPDGTALGSASSAKGKLKLRAVAQRAGAHDVVVRSAPGSFKGTLRVAFPKPRKNLALFDVESMPRVDAVSPGITTNDRVLRASLQGAGFAEGQLFVMRRTGFAPRTATIVPQPVGAQADIDLEDLASGDWQLAVGGVSSRTIGVPGEIVVSNRPVALLSVAPSAMLGGTDVPLTVRGSGFDPDTTFEFVPEGGGSPALVTNFQRSNSGQFVGRISLPQFATGPYDLRIREGTRTEQTFAGALDAVGPTESPALLLASAVPARVVASATDPETGRIGLALESSDGVAFALVDGKSRGLLGYYREDGKSSPRIGWSFADKTWGVSFLDTSGSSPVARARVLENDFSAYRAGVFEVTATSVDPMEPMPRFSGGWTYVWTRNSVGLGAYLESRTADKDGDASLSSTVRHAHEMGAVWHRCRTAERHDGSLLVAWSATSDFQPAPLDYRTCTLFEDGSGTVHAPRTIFTVADWTLSLPSALASDAISGSGCLVTETFDNEDDVVRVFQFEAGGTAPAVGIELERGLADQGRNVTVVWHPARSEFLCGCTQFLTLTEVLRVDRSGAPRVYPVAEVHSGAPIAFVRSGDDVLMVQGSVPVNGTDVALGLHRFR